MCIRDSFDASTSECVIWPFVLPGDFLSTPVLRVIYTMTSDTNTAHGVSIDVSVMALANGADVNTESYATVNNCDDAAIPATAGYPDIISCSLTNFDSATAGQAIKIKLCRATADSADNATGDMEVVGAEFSYSKSVSY